MMYSVYFFEDNFALTRSYSNRMISPFGTCDDIDFTRRYVDVADRIGFPRRRALWKLVLSFVSAYKLFSSSTWWWCGSDPQCIVLQNGFMIAWLVHIAQEISRYGYACGAGGRSSEWLTWKSSTMTVRMYISQRSWPWIQKWSTLWIKFTLNLHRPARWDVSPLHRNHRLK